jgi:hypothetical protein
MTPELRDTTRRVHLLVGKRRPHEVVQLNKNDLVALLAASGRTHARIEAGEVLAHLNDIWAADIERDCGRVVTGHARHDVGPGPDEREATGEAPAAEHSGGPVRDLVSAGSAT